MVAYPSSYTRTKESLALQSSWVVSLSQRCASASVSPTQAWTATTYMELHMWNCLQNKVLDFIYLFHPLAINSLTALGKERQNLGVSHWVKIAISLSWMCRNLRIKPHRKSQTHIQSMKGKRQMVKRIPVVWDDGKERQRGSNMYWEKRETGKRGGSEKPTNKVT